MSRAEAAVGVEVDLAHGKKARLVRRRMLVKQQDAASVTKFLAKLQGHAKKMGGTFVHYNAQDGVWIPKVEHF